MSTNDSKFPRNRIADIVSQIPRSGIRDFFDIVSEKKDVISLGIGEPDFDAPWHIREATIFGLERGSTSYTSNLGLLSLRKALSGYVAKTFKLNYSPTEEILVTVGVSEALDLALRALINPGDEVLYHEPCYVSYRPLVLMAHGVPVAVETGVQDDFRLTRAQLEARLTPKTKVLLLNFPNNPTGAALQEEDVREIAAFAVENDLIVITDEIYSELSYSEPNCISVAAEPGMKERTIFLHGFSKAWAMTGLRIGYACAPAPLLEAMMKIHQYSMLCASITGQEAALEALKNPEKDIQLMRSEYLRRRNFITHSLNEMGLPCHLPGGAFYAFPSIACTGMKSLDFALKLLEEENVACVPGTAFGACGEGFLRCAFATSMDDLKTAMKRMASFVERHRK